MNTGIYKIINIVNNKIYLGSTVKSFKYRWAVHKSSLKYNRHRNTNLQNSWNKYGEENFKFEIIEVCKKDKCLEREQYYIDLLKPEYNKRKFADNNSGIKWSDESKFKIKGRKHSKETRLKMVLNRTIRSEETLIKAANLRKKKVLQFNLNGDFIKEWDSAEDVRKILNIRHIGECCNNKKHCNTAGGFKWKYKYEKDKRNSQQNIKK